MTAQHLRRGVPLDGLLAASFYSPIRYQADAEDLHALLVVPSARAVSSTASREQQLYTVFWTVAFANMWVLPSSHGAGALQVATGFLASDVAQEFAAALQAADAARAASAIAGMYRAKGPQQVRNELWRHSSRSFLDPHRAIYVTQALRALDAFGWGDAEAVLTSVARCLARPISKKEREDPPLERATRLATYLAPHVKASAADGPATLDLLSAMREAPPEILLEEVCAMMNRGVAVASVWDAVLLTACEVLLHETAPSGRGIHALTLSQALLGATQGITDPRAAHVTLLQAVAWLSEMAKQPASSARMRIHTFTPGSVPGSISELMRDSRSPAERVRGALGWLTTNSTNSEYRRALTTSALTRGDDPHVYKYADAFAATAAFISPRWRNHLLATGVLGTRAHSASGWAKTEEVRAAISTLL